MSRTGINVYMYRWYRRFSRVVQCQDRSIGWFRAKHSNRIRSKYRLDNVQFSVVRVWQELQIGPLWSFRLARLSHGHLVKFVIPPCNEVKRLRDHPLTCRMTSIYVSRSLWKRFAMGQRQLNFIALFYFSPFFLIDRSLILFVRFYIFFLNFPRK